MEPSGTIENIPSIVTALLGMFCGEFVRWRKEGFGEGRKVVLMLAGKPWGDVILWSGYVLICWLVLFFLYRKKTFLKV